MKHGHEAADAEGVADEPAGRRGLGDGALGEGDEHGHAHEQTQGASGEGQNASPRAPPPASAVNQSGMRMLTRVFVGLPAVACMGRESRERPASRRAPGGALTPPAEVC